MELAASSSPVLPLNLDYYAVSARPPAITSRNFSPFISSYKTSIRRIYSPFLASKSTGFFLPPKSLGLHRSFLVAVFSNTTAVTDESSKGHMPFNKQSNPKTKDEAVKESKEEQDNKDVVSEGLDEHKMVRICDKLIGVFMVDKPMPTDWRRLLTFSKEWNVIRPYFYKQCQDRAGSENNPEMKHKLLRLARKLREIDEDVRRHNELLGAIRKSPSEVGDIVARRRKDFTKEFFLHVHTVAESYYDNPTEQNDSQLLKNSSINLCPTTFNI